MAHKLSVIFDSTISMRWDSSANRHVMQGMAQQVADSIRAPPNPPESIGDKNEWLRKRDEANRAHGGRGATPPPITHGSQFGAMLFNHAPSAPPSLKQERSNDGGAVAASILRATFARGSPTGQPD